MNIMDVNQKNIEKEHICCAISDIKGECCVSSKKEWLSERFQDGLVFKKLEVRGKVFIEYIPAEKAWCPIIADQYMFINCFWVSGQYKGKGYADALLEACILDAKQKGKKGLVVLTSIKKMPFLSDPKYLKYKGFLKCDFAEPFFELLYLPFSSEVEMPQFKECCKKGAINSKGWVLYYSNQCPHTEKYVPLIAKIATAKGVNISLIKYQTTEQAQNAPSPFTTYSLFVDGEFVTNEILSEKKFSGLVEERTNPIEKEL